MQCLHLRDMWWSAVGGAGGANKGGFVLGDSRLVHLEALGDDDAGSGQHSPPGVDELVCAVLLHGGGVLAQTQRVVAIAAPA